MKRVWKAKNGIKFKIKEMTTSHIKNCIAILQRYHEAKRQEMYAIQSFVTAEQATIHIDNALLDIEENGFEDDADEYILSFENELSKRGEMRE